jgi:hypothetical protein
VLRTSELWLGGKTTAELGLRKVEQSDAPDKAVAATKDDDDGTYAEDG